MSEGFRRPPTRQEGPSPSWGIEVASVIELSEASGRVAAGLFMTEG